MKIILYMAISSDNFIAAPDGSVDFLNRYQDPDFMNLPGAQAFMEEHNNFIVSIDVLIMGRRSYEHTITFGPWAWPEKKSYVFTDDFSLPKVHESISFVSGQLKDVLDALKKQENKEQKIWLFGGAHLVKQFDKEGLITDIILTRVPERLGEGIKLVFDHAQYNLIERKSCVADIMQERYEKS